MIDEQRDHLAQILDSINDRAAKNKLEATYEGAKQRLDTFIRERRIGPRTLPSYVLRKVVMGCDSMTIVTFSGHYVHVSAEPGCHGNVDFCTDGSPDIEDAHDMSILSKEQYDEYKDAQQAYLGHRRETTTRNRIVSIVREAGAATVQEYLDELN